MRPVAVHRLEGFHLAAAGIAVVSKVGITVALTDSPLQCVERYLKISTIR